VIDKLEVGQVRIWNDHNDGEFTIKYVGVKNCVIGIDEEEIVLFLSYILSYSKPVKPEPKEIKVKYYRGNGSIFCTDTNYQKSKHWEEIDFINGKFFEKTI